MARETKKQAPAPDGRNRVEKEEVSRSQALKILGRPGLKQWGGYIYEEWLPQLTGVRAIRVYREMWDNDPVVGAIHNAVEQLVRRAEWSVQPGEDNSEGRRAADFLAECQEDMDHSWDDLVSEALSMLPYGWAYHEEVFKIRSGDARDPRRKSRHDDGFFGWRRIALRGQETLDHWEFDEEGEIKGLWQAPPPDYVLRFVPIEKAVLFRTSRHKNNPEGRSILRNAYRPWWFKKRFEEIEGIGIERDLAGYPVIRVPADLLKEDAPDWMKALRRDLEAMVTEIRRDEREGILLPNKEEGYDIQLLSTGGRRMPDTSAIIERYDRRIAGTALADFLLIGGQRTGSYALVSSRTELFANAIGTYLDIMAEAFNTHSVPRLFRLNDGLPGFPKVEALPYFEHGDIEERELEELGNFLQALAGAGMEVFPNPELERAVLRAARLPEEGVEKAASLLVGDD